MRKTLRVPITAEGRDKGKVFVITEMSAAQAEKWAMRCFLGMAKSGVQIPDNVMQMGMGGIAEIGIRAITGLSFADAEPLMDEMWACISIAPDPSHPELLRRLIDDDTEEFATRFALRMKVLELHTGFSMAAAAQRLQGAGAATTGLPNTPTSRES